MAENFLFFYQGWQKIKYFFHLWLKYPQMKYTLPTYLHHRYFFSISLYQISAGWKNFPSFGLYSFQWLKFSNFKDYLKNENCILILILFFITSRHSRIICLKIKPHQWNNDTANSEKKPGGSYKHPLNPISHGGPQKPPLSLIAIAQEPW